MARITRNWKNGENVWINIENNKVTGIYYDYDGEHHVWSRDSELGVETLQRTDVKDDTYIRRTVSPLTKIAKSLGDGQYRFYNGFGKLTVTNETTNEVKTYQMVR